MSRQRIPVHRDRNGVWQPSKYVNDQTKIVLDVDRRGVPQPRGYVLVRVREESEAA